MRIHTESPQEHADRLLSEHQAARRRFDARRKAHRRYARQIAAAQLIIIPGAPTGGERLRAALVARFDRFRAATRPWVEGFDTPLMDAVGVAFILIFGIILGALAAMMLTDPVPPASTHAPRVEAIPSPAAVTPLGGGANGGSI